MRITQTLGQLAQRKETEDSRQMKTERRTERSIYTDKKGWRARERKMEN